MSEVETLTNELNEAKNEYKSCEQEYLKLKYHMEHLNNVINDRKAKLNHLRRGTLPPVKVTLYKRDENDEIIERETHLFNRVSDAIESGIDFTNTNYMDMSITCDFEEGDFGVVFSMDFDKLCQPIAEGNVVIVSHNGYWTDTGEDFYTGILKSPTYFYALQEFYNSIFTTKDKHHIFLEGISPIGGSEADKLRKKYGDDVKFFTFCTGS